MRRLAMLSVSALAAVSIAGVPDTVRAQNAPPRQFTDAEYLANGLDPTKFVDALNGSNQNSTLHPDGTIEINQVTGGFSHQGNLIYYTAISMITEEAFTDDAAGREARELADTYVAYIFPKRTGAQFAPPFGNRRQDNIFDTRNGYHSNNPLGLWKLAFVKWLDLADSADPGVCAELREELVAANDVDLDGTPAIHTVNEIEELREHGCILVRSRQPDGTVHPHDVLPGEIVGPPGLFRWVA